MIEPVFTIQGVTVYHADCRDVLPHLTGVDAVVTDPPYGVNIGDQNLGKWRASTMKGSRWDKEKPDLSSLADSYRCMIWGGNYFVLPPSRCWFIWNKGAGFKGRDFAEAEMAWCSWDGNTRELTYDPLTGGDYKQKLHPTQKPLAVMLASVEHTGGHVILDPFAGSGTTGVACIKTGRRCILIEKEAKYVEIIRRRLLEASTPLLDGLDD